MKTSRAVIVIVLFLGFLFGATSCAVRVQPENRTRVRWYQSSPERHNQYEQRREQRHLRHLHRSNQVEIRVEDRH